MVAVLTRSVLGRATVLLLSALSLAAASSVQLAEAVKQRNTSAVRALVKQKVDVNARQPDGTTALHWAAHWDDLDTADLLIRAGARANVANELGVTPLALACTNGNAAMVEKLLATGADPNGVSTEQPVLLTCVRSGSVGAVKALLAEGADVNGRELGHGQTALMWAAAERHPKVVRLLLESGADLQARSTITRELVNTGDHHNSVECCCCPIQELLPRGGSTALMFAVRNNDLDSLKLLLAAGASVNDTIADGNSALVVALHSGHGKLAAVLVDKGADPNAAGAGYTALHAAVLMDDLELVKMLVAHGANPNARLTKGTPTTRFGVDRSLQAALVGATPYLLAAKFAELEMMRVLAASGADTRLAMKDGHTPLMVAAGVVWLGGIDNRREQDLPAHERVPDQDGTRTLGVVTLALELGSDVNAVNEDGDSALHLAASNGLDPYAKGAAANRLDPVVRLLVERGANVEASNKRGQTPLMTASRSLGSDTSSVAELLRSLGAKK